MKLLLVTTDERISRDVRGALVGEPDLDILEVRTPHRALVQLLGGDFDVVVADNDTAPTGGFALSREMKAHRRMGAEMPPVVLLLARAQDRWLAKWSEADAYLEKPVDLFDLLELVRALADGQAVPALPGVHTPTGPLSDDMRGIEDGPAQAATIMSSGP